MYKTQSIKTHPLLKQALFSLLLLSIVMLFPDIASATDETGEEVTKTVLENLVKYAKWIAFAIIGFAFIMVGYFCLRAYGAWADEDNNKGTMPRLVMTVFFGIMILALVTTFVTKGAKYLEENVVTTTAAVTPVIDTIIT